MSTPTVAPTRGPSGPAAFLADVAEAWGWVRQTPAAWRKAGWPRRSAAWAIAGVIGDAVTTSLMPHVGGVHEANPLSAAGQAALGSVPLFMLVVSVPLVLALALMANEPRNAAQWTLWSLLAFAGGIKVAVTLNNIAVLHAAVAAQTILVT